MPLKDGGGEGACFGTWLLCFYFLFSMQVNHRLCCWNVCLWEDFCCSCSLSAWSSGWRRSSLGRTGRSCCWLARLPGADTGIVLINALLLLAWQTGKEINLPPPLFFISTAFHRVPGWVFTRCPRTALEWSLLVWEKWNNGGGTVSSIPSAPHPGRTQLLPLRGLSAPVSLDPHLDRWQL